MELFQGGFSRQLQLPWQYSLYFHLVLVEMKDLVEVVTIMLNDRVVDRHQSNKQYDDLGVWVVSKGLLHHVDDLHPILGSCEVEKDCTALKRPKSQMLVLGELGGCFSNWIFPGVKLPLASSSLKVDCITSIGHDRVQINRDLINTV